MLAGPDTPLPTMLIAVNYSFQAFGVAAEIDTDLGKDQQKLFAALEKRADKLVRPLLVAKRAIEDYDLAKGSRLQARVEVGDAVLDRGIANGRKRTGLALDGKPGLGVTHVFGATLSTLTREKIALEPGKVLDAVGRFADVTAFSERASIAKDLTARAKTQQKCLDDRDDGDKERNKLVGKGVVLVSAASLELASMHGDLSSAFPRQKDYVDSFFYDVRPYARPQTPQGGATGGGGGGGPGTGAAAT